MRGAIISVSIPVLEQLLRLPAGTRIHRVRQSWDQENARSFQMLIESVNLPDVPEGKKYPETYIIISQHSDAVIVEPK